MLSTFPVMLSTDGLFRNQIPVFEGGFTPWDCQEPPLVFPHQDETFVFPRQPQEPVLPPTQPQEPVISNSESDHSNPIAINSSSGSDDPNRNHESPNSGSDERKRKRMMSNRESARRSRMRKQKHLENLRNQVTRLRTGNRELMNRLHSMTHRCQLVRIDNERLLSESNILRQRLWDIRQVLYVRELQQQICSTAMQ